MEGTGQAVGVMVEVKIRDMIGVMVGESNCVSRWRGPARPGPSRGRGTKTGLAKGDEHFDT